MTNQPAPPKTPNTPDAKPVTSALRAGRDFIMVIGGAVAIALLIKSFVFDVYLIPSGSMETALHGRPDGGDRILASKLNYHFRPPRRWEVAVFEFPYESARRNDPSANPESYRGQNFVKRIVGMPGESLAIARGDIWTRPDHDPGAPFQRQVKPDTVQQGIWLNVAQEDFQDITAAELATFWNFPDNGSVQVDPEAEALQLTPGEKEVSISYRPQIPVGEKRDNLVELRGIPDRYVLEQPIQFRCRAILEDGSVCSHVFVKSFTAQNIQARCPVCGTMANELSSIFYHRRSGLTASGRYRVSPSATTQGEEVAPRQADYHLVPDLRLALDLTLQNEFSWLAIAISEDNRQAEAVFHADGRVEIRLNHQPSRPEHRALATIRPRQTTRVEFYLLDGVARVYVGDQREPLLDVEVWPDKRPNHRSLPGASGARFTARGVVTVDNVELDRDVFYYSGWETDYGEKFPLVGSRGEVRINNESFLPMGDHCPSSYDARSWGPVPLDNLLGPAVLVWWPPERLRLIPIPPR